MSLVAYGESSGSEDEDNVRNSLEPCVGGNRKMQDVRKLLSVLPVAGKRKNQPVRLAIPTLNSEDSDDESGPSRKRNAVGARTQITHKSNATLHVWDNTWTWCHRANCNT